jgi:hypothetical protein
MVKIRDAKWYEELMFSGRYIHNEYWLLNTFRTWKEKQVWGCISKGNGNTQWKWNMRWNNLLWFGFLNVRCTSTVVDLQYERVKRRIIQSWLQKICWIINFLNNTTISNVTPWNLVPENQQCVGICPNHLQCKVMFAKLYLEHTM